MNGNWHRIAATGDVPAGCMKPFGVEGREVLVCNTRDGWFALDNTCTHAEAKMNEGRLRGCRVTCPLHGASFDVRQGNVLGGPADAPLRSYAIRIVAGAIEVEMPAPEETPAPP
jgi:3-phenylpropionate/trans-cinnamate dioxygenase ferredoxin subunit